MAAKTSPNPTTSSNPGINEPRITDLVICPNKDRRMCGMMIPVQATSISCRCDSFFGSDNECFETEFKDIQLSCENIFNILQLRSFATRELEFNFSTLMISIDANWFAQRCVVNDVDFKFMT